MSGLEFAIAQLGSAVVTQIARALLGTEGTTAPEQSLRSVISRRIADRKQQRRLERSLNQLADAVSDHLTDTVDDVDLSEIERYAAVQAATDTFIHAQLAVQDLRAAEMNPAVLERHLSSARETVLRSASLSSDAVALYSTLLRQSCTMLTEITPRLPDSPTGVTSVLLDRMQEELIELSHVLDRVPTQPPAQLDSPFETSYRRFVASTLDRLEWYGVHLPSAARGQSLTEAYTPRTMSLNGGKTSSDTALADHRRMLLVGEAGSGKTTLMAWLAVSVARRSCAGALTEFNDLLPFYLPLRRLVDNPLPTPDDIVEAIAPGALNTPTAALRDRFEHGRVLMLIDGLDEIALPARTRVRQWISALVSRYPAARFLFTSRPSAEPMDWLADTGFVKAELLPLDTEGVSTMVTRWFHAAITEPDQREFADLRARRLIREIDEKPELAGLAGTPLLCSLMCAASFDREIVPNRRAELYSLFVDTLLDRRDTSRRIVTYEQALSRAEKLTLLQKLAWWLVQNERSEINVTTALVLIQDISRHLVHVTSSPEALYHYLLERSGLLREPEPGKLQFVHQTFQEYLAAKEAADCDHIDSLVQVAHRQQWQDVVALAAGHCYPNQTDKLLIGLLQRVKTEPENRQLLVGTLDRCVDMATRINPKIREEVTYTLRNVRSSNEASETRVAAQYRLIDSLLDLSCMREQSGRRAVIGMLPPSHAATVSSDHNSRRNVAEIVRVCSSYRSGITDLLAAVREIEGESVALRHLEDVVNEISPEIATNDSW